MKWFKRLYFARRLTEAERDVFDAACRLCLARAGHKRNAGHAEELDDAWKRLNGLRRQARVSGLFEKATAP